jgi:hypothetical protein
MSPVSRPLIALRHNTVAVILCNVRDAAQADWDLNSAWWARYFTLNAGRGPAGVATVA